MLQTRAHPPRLGSDTVDPQPITKITKITLIGLAPAALVGSRLAALMRLATLVGHGVRRVASSTSAAGASRMSGQAAIPCAAAGGDPTSAAGASPVSVIFVIFVLIIGQARRMLSSSSGCPARAMASAGEISPALTRRANESSSVTEP